MKTPEEKDAYVKASRKAAPKTTQAWLAEVGGITRFVDSKTKMLDTNGAAWLLSMRGYYAARLDFLLANAPPGFTKKTAQAIVKDVRAKLA